MHISVLQKEALQYLDVQSGRNYIDATVNGGGDARAILERNAPNGKVLGIDWDAVVLSTLKTQVAGSAIEERLTLADGIFADIQTLAQNAQFPSVHGVLFDFGLSSWQLDESGRGFSFLRDEPLDMRFRVDGLSARDFISDSTVDELARVFREYGEERFASRIARTIVEERRTRTIATTRDLVAVMFKARGVEAKRIDSAFIASRVCARTFQALRIAVNDELGQIERALPEALELLEPGGRLVAISFHSLEDRIVKTLFRNWAAEGRGEVLTKKPVVPLAEETENNPRSRSGKLRAFRKMQEKL